MLFFLARSYGPQLWSRLMLDRLDREELDETAEEAIARNEEPMGIVSRSESIVVMSSRDIVEDAHRSVRIARDEFKASKTEESQIKFRDALVEWFAVSSAYCGLDQ